MVYFARYLIVLYYQPNKQTKKAMLEKQQVRAQLPKCWLAKLAESRCVRFAAFTGGDRPDEGQIRGERQGRRKRQGRQDQGVRVPQLKQRHKRRGRRAPAARATTPCTLCAQGASQPRHRARVCGCVRQLGDRINAPTRGAARAFAAKPPGARRPPSERSPRARAVVTSRASSATPTGLNPAPARHGAKLETPRLSPTSPPAPAATQGLRAASVVGNRSPAKPRRPPHPGSRPGQSPPRRTVGPAGPRTRTDHTRKGDGSGGWRWPHGPARRAAPLRRFTEAADARPGIRNLGRGGRGGWAG